MSGFSTPVGAIQDALAAAIGALITTAGVKMPAVGVGYPAGGPQKNHIWIAAGADVDVLDELTGYAERDESTVLEVDAVATVTGTSYPAARDACLVLVGYLEAALAADRTIGGRCQYAAVLSVSLREGIPDDRSRQCGARVLVAVTSSVSAS